MRSELVLEALEEKREVLQGEVEGLLAKLGELDAEIEKIKEADAELSDGRGRRHSVKRAVLGFLSSNPEDDYLISEIGEATGFNTQRIRKFLVSAEKEDLVIETTGNQNFTRWQIVEG
jgi:hypothetical protein